MKKPTKLLSAIVVLLISQLYSPISNADTLDFFGEIGTGFYGNSTAVLTNATIVGSGTDLFFSSPLNWGSTHGSFCSYSPSNCEVDVKIQFHSKVMDLNFESYLFDQNDAFTVFAYNGASFLGSSAITSGGLVDLSGYGIIDRIFLDDQSSNSGVEYGSFDFKVSTVPLPTALPLFASAIAGLGFLGWRRKKTPNK